MEQSISPSKSATPGTISVITVVRNAESVIESTILSVLEQTYRPIEFVVVDGASSDGTLSILERYRSRIARIISEPDRSVYDGMNKGISCSTGNWLLFLNAGDRFIAQDTVEKASVHLANDAALVYGDFRMDGEIHRPRTLREFRYAGPLGCHQSMFFHRARCRDQLRYDLRYRTFADWDLALRLYETMPEGLRQLALPIADYQGGGISYGFRWSKVMERAKLLYQHGGVPRLVQGFLSKGIAEARKLI